MASDRADLLIAGQVVVAFGERGIDAAEAIAIGNGQVLATGSLHDLRDAYPGTREVQAEGHAVVPGLHDFHLHLVGMARARRVVDLTDARSTNEILERLAQALGRAAPGEWLRGDGWWTETLDADALPRLEALVGDRPTLLKSHDRHSAWASASARARAGIDERTADPPGGRIERGDDGRPNGVLRERAADLVADLAGRLTGPPLTAALRDVAAELAAWGITGATDAGDPTVANGIGSWATLGDSFSSLAEAGEALAAQLRLTVNLPVDALEAAAELGLRYGSTLGSEGSLMRVGWAKVYADGALGSRTAAVFEPYRCVDAGDQDATTKRGLLRLSPEQLDEELGTAIRHRIPLAIHALGDRSASLALDAFERARLAAPPAPHRVEHLQLLRGPDRRRLAAMGLTASLQPVHLPSDRDAAERCWGDRLADAYAWRSLEVAGARIAFGSDAPIEHPNPWLCVHAAVRRARPGETPPEWGRDEGLSPMAALRAYTAGPALAAGRPDLGHLGAGARADLAVLNVDLDTLLEADERIASVRSILTLVDGREVHRE